MLQHFSDKRKVSNYQFFSCSITIISLQPCSQRKWMPRIQLGEWEWMDLVFSLPCSTKLCTGALFIHKTRPCSSDPLTKKSRINWQHQSEDTANRQLSSSVHDANNIQNGKKQSPLSFMSHPLGSYAKTQLHCGVFNLSTPGSPRFWQEYPD